MTVPSPARAADTEGASAMSHQGWPALTTKPEVSGRTFCLMPVKQFPSPKSLRSSLGQTHRTNQTDVLLGFERPANEAMHIGGAAGRRQAGGEGYRG